MQQASTPLHLLVSPPRLPTGCITLLFSDIEGSTSRWERFPEAMHIALAQHDAILSNAIAGNNGVVFKTVGDAFCAVFERTTDAVNAALHAQRQLHCSDWSAVAGLQVRMAIHQGTPNLRDSDYFGPPVNRVARLLNAAHGGQVLISADVFRALESCELPGDIELRDLGRHRLRDFPDMESIYQLVAPGMPDVFPLLRTIVERPSNLPQQLVSLLGRDEDIAHTVELLETHRAVSILGSGGVGKTSLALTVGSQLLPAYEDGVWLIELAPLADAASVIPAVASTLHLTGAANASVIDTIVAYLKNKRALIIFDNCEHVISAAAQLAHQILSACVNVRVLATSREPLAIPGEARYRLPSLSIPPESALTAQEVREYGAPALFEERARAHVPSFEITDANARVVADICRRLDGIALAIELAAPRLRMLSLPQLSERLAERFRILTGGSRTALPRHQTMRALIEWSFDLLSDSERVLLRRAGVFAGGWTLGAAMDVCADESLEAWEVLDYLTSLVDKSLVVAETEGEEARYRILESTREFALEQLAQNNEHETFVRRHAEYYLQIARRADEAWSNFNAKDWIAPLLADLDNFRAVLSWSISRHADPSLGVALFGALEAFWWDAQPIEGRRWIGELTPIVQSLDVSSETAKFWLTAANVALTLREQKAALADADRALEAYGKAGDDLGIAASIRCRGAALTNLGRIDEGELCVATALETFRGCGHRRLTALALRSLGLAPRLRGELDRAAPIYREALSYAQSLGDERGMQILCGNLAEVEFDLGDYEQALEHAREGLTIARARRDRIITCGFLINICAYLIALERYEEARRLAHEAMVLARELQSDLFFGVAAQHAAAVLSVGGDPERAALLLGFSNAVYAACESVREPTEQKEYDTALPLLHARLAADRIDALMRQGEEISQEQALQLALTE